MPDHPLNTHPPKPVQKREIFGWAMFDFANSSYTTVVITVIYSAFFVEYIVPANSEFKDSYWSIAMIIPTLLSMILSPFIGVLCDYSGHKKRYLWMTTLLCSLATMGLYWVEPGNIMLGVIFLTISSVGFMLSESFCGSFLTDIANKNNMALISGIGWGIGYVGGLASLIMVMHIITADAKTQSEIYIQQNQWSMVAIGLFFMIGALPTFFFVRERSQPALGFESFNWIKLLKAGLTDLKASIHLVKTYKVLFQFLVAFTIYMAGVDAVIKFVGIYAKVELAFTTPDLTIMFLILQFSAMAGALGFGILETYWGPKLTVLATLVWWMIGVLGVYFLEQLANLFSAEAKQVFFLISLIAGAGIGAVQSSSRAVVGMLTPRQHSGQLFGFWGMFGRLATILGMGYGFVSDVSESRRIALLLILGFFVVGAIMLYRIPLNKGIEFARLQSSQD